MSNHDNLATNKDLKRITDHAIKAKERIRSGAGDREYRRLVVEQNSMINQIKRERRD